jgi:hypothetical protein
VITISTTAGVTRRVVASTVALTSAGAARVCASAGAGRLTMKPIAAAITPVLLTSIDIQPFTADQPR